MKSLRIIILVCITAKIFAIPTPENDDNEGFLESTCNEDQDCHITGGVGLACWHSEKKCKCFNTIASDYTLLWSDNKCRMSKYGPCGKKGTLEVDCLDGFKCIKDQCRDPKNPTASVSGPYIFDQKCNGCQFSEDLDLECDSKQDKCSCKKVYIADGSDTSWDIRNYDGDKNCSVGKFGPCGTKSGIKIDCHGTGISCVDGTCLDAAHPISLLNNGCESKKNCKKGLLCSPYNICIKRNTLVAGKLCNSKAECLAGLKCGRPAGSDPLTSSTTCGEPSSFSARIRKPSRKF